MDGRKPKKKLYENNLHKLNREMEEVREREKLQALRVENQKSEIESLRRTVEQLKAEVGGHREVRTLDPIINETFKDEQAFTKSKKTALMLGLHKKLTRPRRFATS